MFGQLKESVLTNLEKEYAQNGETKFKKQFAKYVKVLKENKSSFGFYSKITWK